MADKSIIWIVVIGIAVVLVLGGMLQKSYNIFSVLGSETITRTIPSSVQPNQNFNIIYSVSGVSGIWGASIIDTVSGGCKFPDGSELKSVMLSTEGTAKTIAVTAPSSGSCTFHGDYKFGTASIKDFEDITITISTSAQETEEEEEEGETGEQEIPFDINMVLFKIGNFNVTLLILVGAIILLFILINLIPKK